MKKVFVLSHDYWHHSDSIEPLMKLLFDNKYEVTFTTNPIDYYKCNPDLFISFKDPIENDQIPTPVWCDEQWTDKFMEDVQNGMGAIILHAAVTDLPSEHRIIRNIVRAEFETHPEQCPVSFVPILEHPLLEGVEKFEFPTNDEHYVMKFLEGVKTTLVASTQSKNGVQPGMWFHDFGIGKICCITPGHNTENLTYAPFVQLLKNSILWCVRN